MQTQIKQLTSPCSRKIFPSKPRAPKITFLQCNLLLTVTVVISFNRYSLSALVIYFPFYCIFLMLSIGGFQSFKAQVSAKPLVSVNHKL